MNETRTHKGPNPRLLLLIPAVLIIARAGRHRRAVMDQGWGGPGATRPPRSPSFSGPADETGRRAFRLPPRIESALDAWHIRSHEASDAAGPESEAGSATA